MTNPDPEDIFHSYIQSDAPLRATIFPAFLNALKHLVAVSRTADAGHWAKRAISVDLDYSSHLSLRRFARMNLATGKDKLRVAVLGGPTTAQLSWLLDNFLAAHGIESEIWEGEYGLFRQSILTPDPDLDAFAPHLLFIATNMLDVSVRPELEMAEEVLAHQINLEFEQWQHLWHTANARWGCQIIQNLFDIPPWHPLGHFGRRCRTSEPNVLERLNRLMAEQAPDYVALHDQQAVAFEAGGAQIWFDPRYYHEAKMPCSPECLVPYAHSVAALIAALKGKSKKVAVLDLDNTLWGGVIGDDGLGGIVVGQGSAVGESYLAFQRYLKALSRRGILLAVCSKNEAINAREPFLKIPDMVLKLDDFVAFVANWNNKADNLRRIAEELNLGLDSFIFIDDNPAERALVRRYLPEVATPDMPADPAEYIAAVARHRYFEMAALTTEDLQRSDYYIRNRQRRELESAHTDVEAFLASLEMTARVEPIYNVNLERSVQLINKSNQFNLTTRRYTLAEISQRLASPAWVTLTISLQDKFGDNGLISVILAEIRDKTLAIDTWVMSCRVLQRGVEYLAANELAMAALRCGCCRLTGMFIPTAKNGMVADHYARLGFEKTDEDPVGTTRWVRHLAQEPVLFPTHIQTVRSDITTNYGNGG